MQSYVEINENQTMKESLPLLLNNIKTAISQNSGSAFPSANLQLGMSVYRADQKKLYVLSNDVTPTWTLVFDANTGRSPDSDKLGGVSAANYLQRSGGTMTAPLKFTGSGIGRAIQITNDASLDNTDASIYIGNVDYGWDLEYLGSGNGNTNAFRLRSSTNEAFRVNQDGIMQFAQIGATIAGNTIWHTGNDGSGSGLDADTVDGLQASQLLRSDVDDTVSGRLTFIQDISVGAQTGTWITSNVMADAIGWNPSYGIYIGSNIGGTHYIRGNGTFTTNGGTYSLWHAGNDGAGSGLDADTVDGLQAGQFVRRDTFDLVFGNHDQSTRGSSGSSRALVKELGKLTINFDNDFGKTRIKGTAVEITHNLGVGTDVPTEKVDVIGKVKARDGIVVGSSGTAHIAYNDATQCLEFNFV